MPPDHPLDPIRPDEISTAADLVRAHSHLGPHVRFVFILLVEPDRVEIESWQAGGPRPPRRAKAVVLDKKARRNYDVVVDLDAGQIQEIALITGAQPAVIREESVEAERLARQHPDWQKAMRRRGIVDLDLAMIDHMPAGYQGHEQDPTRRLGLALTWMRAAVPADSGVDDNGYARPVEGVIVHFDLDEMRVLSVEDHDPVSLPTMAGNYSATAIAMESNYPYFPDGPRQDLKPLEIAQPEGPSFTLDGHRLTWQKWSLRVGFNGREGLTIHDVRYQDGDRDRTVLHRASLSEMFVPYGDPGVTHYRKQLFDEGEAGIGRSANSLVLGCDCLGEIRYLDGVVNDNNGNPVTISNAICIHEEDYGTLWKHTALRSGYTEVRRSRRLVVSSISTVGNYEYGFFWYFYTDGTIQHEMKLNGILSTGAVEPGQVPEYGGLVAPGVYGPNHQHWFNVRLHMAVDGGPNRLYEVDSRPDTSERNHFGNAWSTHKTPLVTEHQARRDMDIMASRYWKVTNPDQHNRLGQPTGYKLVPGENVGHMYRPDAIGLRRAAFIEHHLWATPYRAEEMYAAGEHPNQHPGGAGLPAWTQADRRLDGDDDIVLWYTFGAHHEPRTEDWPVMPVHYIGFHLKPSGFFDGNPALDLPESPSNHCQHHGH
jgi:primary-amine oxidase